MSIIEEFYNWAKGNNWTVKLRDEPSIELPDEIMNRYPRIPSEYLEFLKLIEYCITPDEQSWFLCIQEYNGTSDDAFSWDEFEKISLIEGDNKNNERIEKFWNSYFPIMLSVGSDYEYYALDVYEEFGSVVNSFQPYFEEPRKVSSSFFEFLDMIMKEELSIT